VTLQDLPIADCPVLVEGDPVVVVMSSEGRVALSVQIDIATQVTTTSGRNGFETKTGKL